MGADGSWLGGLWGAAEGPSADAATEKTFTQQEAAAEREERAWIEQRLRLRIAQQQQQHDEVSRGMRETYADPAAAEEVRRWRDGPASAASGYDGYGTGRHSDGSYGGGRYGDRRDHSSSSSHMHSSSPQPSSASLHQRGDPRRDATIGDEGEGLAVAIAAAPLHLHGRAAQPHNGRAHAQESAGGASPMIAASSSSAAETEERLSLWEARAAVSQCWRDAVALFRTKCGARPNPSSSFATGLGPSPPHAATAHERSLMAVLLMNCQLETDGKAPHRCAALQPTGGRQQHKRGVFSAPFASFFGGGGGEGGAHSHSADPHAALFGPHLTPDAVRRCVGSLDDPLYPVYIQFRLHLDTLCFYVGEEAARERMEASARTLHIAADVAAGAVLAMEAKAAHLEASMGAAAAAMLQRFDAHLGTAEGHVRSLVESAAAIAGRHEEAMGRADEHQTALRGLLEASAEALGEQQGTLGEILASAANLSEHAVVQHRRMAASSGEVLSVLDRIYALQRGIADSLGLARLAWAYAAMAGACAIASMPARTAAARPIALLLVAFGAYAEYGGVYGRHAEAEAFVFALHATPVLGWAVLPQGAALVLEGLRRGRGRSSAIGEDDVVDDEGGDAASCAMRGDGSALGDFALDLATRLWRRFVVAAIVLVFSATAWLHETAEARLRRVVADAFRSVVGHQDGPTSSSRGGSEEGREASTLVGRIANSLTGAFRFSHPPLAEDVRSRATSAVGSPATSVIDSARRRRR